MNYFLVLLISCLHKSVTFSARIIWTQKGESSVEHYLALICMDVTNLNKIIWMLKTLLKKLWYLHRGVILTKDNLAKCNWHGSKKYCFCQKKKQNAVLSV